MQKHFIYFLFAIIWNYQLEAQTFSNSVYASIPDNTGQQVLIPINVSGLPTAMNMTFGLKKVCINMRHTFASDLQVKLIAPVGGDSMKIMDRNGGGEDITVNLCFTETAINDIVNYPILGATTYFGVESINDVNDGRNPNGTWYLLVRDRANIDTGYVQGVSLEFGASPAPSRPRNNPNPNPNYVCSPSYPYLCFCPNGNDSCELLPDLSNSKSAIMNGYYEEPGKLFFAVATPNIGWGPLEIHAYDTVCFCGNTRINCGAPCPTGITKKREVFQTVYYRNDSNMIMTDRRIGLMAFDSSKVLIDNWTSSKLLLPTKDPNPLNWRVINNYSHQSNCLINTHDCSQQVGFCSSNGNDTLINADILNYGFGSVTGCGLNQGIYVGYMEQKEAGYPGQQVDLPLPCNGAYYVMVTTDPDNLIKEANESNNWTLIKFNITHQQNTCCKANFYADKTVGIDSLTVQFSDSTLPIANSWLWDFGDGTTSTQQFPIHHYNQSGLYTVKLYTSSEIGCSDTIVKPSFIQVNSPNGINDINKAGFLRVSPNPFSDNIILDFSVLKTTSAQIDIMDIAGKTIFSKNYVIDNYNPIVIQTESHQMSSGAYFLKASYNGKSSIFKIVKL